MPLIEFEGTKFTIITDEKGEPWFIAKELCEYLGLKNVGMACKKIPDCNKRYMVFDHLKTTGQGTGRGGDNGVRIIINEPGIYRQIARSRKPVAKEFHVGYPKMKPPTIRKTGSYSIQSRIEAQKSRPNKSPGCPKHAKGTVQHFLVQIEENEKLIAINTDW